MQDGIDAPVGLCDATEFFDPAFHPLSSVKDTILQLPPALFPEHYLQHLVDDFTRWRVRTRGAAREVDPPLCVLD